MGTYAHWTQVTWTCCLSLRRTLRLVPSEAGLKKRGVVNYFSHQKDLLYVYICHVFDGLYASGRVNQANASLPFRSPPEPILHRTHTLDNTLHVVSRKQKR